MSEAYVIGKEKKGGPRDGLRAIELALPLSAPDAKAIAKAIKKWVKWCEGGPEPEEAEPCEKPPWADDEDAA